MSRKSQIIIWAVNQSCLRVLDLLQWKLNNYVLWLTIFLELNHLNSNFMKEIFYRSPNLAHRKNKTKVLEQKPKVKKVWKQKFGKQKPTLNGTLFCSYSMWSLILQTGHTKHLVFVIALDRADVTLVLVTDVLIKSYLKVNESRHLKSLDMSTAPTTLQGNRKQILCGYLKKNTTRKTTLPLEWFLSKNESQSKSSIPNEKLWNSLSFYINTNDGGLEDTVIKIFEEAGVKVTKKKLSCNTQIEKQQSSNGEIGTH